jgi:3',5'-cyclic-AMP phosphodiesterase
MVRAAPRIMTDNRTVRVLHVTDPHLMGDQSRELYGVNTALSFRKVLREALGSGGAPPDVILATGDIADDLTPEAYDNFLAALHGVGAPVLCLPGNHDDPALMREMLAGDAVHFCHGLGFEGWDVILLDTHVADDPSGHLATSELSRLEAELAAQPDRHALVCLHHPPLGVGSAWIDALGLRNAGEFLAVIDRFQRVRAVLAGHVHQASDQWRGKVRFLTTPSTCAQFTPKTDTCLMDLRPPGYRWLHLMPDGTVETESCWLRDWVLKGRPPDDRF